MLRRNFIKSLGALSFSLLPSFAWAAEKTSTIPLLMFHKVVDDPEYPEDISTSQLEALFSYMWHSGYYPINISDVLDNKISTTVPRGLMPVAITADDAHSSIFFSKAQINHPQQRNAKSFIEIFKNSLKPFNYAPRATFFISAVGDDRYSKEPEVYFGGHLPLSEILQSITKNLGIEIGYHTRIHKSMKNMNASEVREIIEDQVADLKQENVYHLMTPILAYPYGVLPSEAGVLELAKMGFKGAVLAFPGNSEASYSQIAPCVYENKLVTSAFHLPRVCIGAYTYTPKGSSVPYMAIDPIEDFKKDIK